MEGVGPEVDFLTLTPTPSPPLLFFCWTMFPLGVVSRLGRRWWLRPLLLRMLRKTRALETLEVSGMEKEVGLWEVVASSLWRRWGGVGNGK